MKTEVPETPEEALARLVRLQKLIDKLAQAHGDFEEQQEIAQRLRDELADARIALQPFLKNKLGT